MIVALGERTHEVVVTRSGTTAIVWIDGIEWPTSTTGDAIVIEGRREPIYVVAVRDDVFVHAFGRAWKLQITDPAEVTAQAGKGTDVAIAPMPGVVIAIRVAPGDAIRRGQVVAVIESMKMHTEIQATRDAVVDRLLVAVGETFQQGAPLVTFVPEET